MENPSCGLVFLGQILLGTIITSVLVPIFLIISGFAHGKVKIFFKILSSIFSLGAFFTALFFLDIDYSVPSLNWDESQVMYLLTIVLSLMYTATILYWSGPTFSWQKSLKKHQS